MSDEKVGKFKVRNDGVTDTVTVRRRNRLYVFTWTCGADYEATPGKLKRQLELVQELPPDPSILVSLQDSTGMDMYLRPLRRKGRVELVNVEGYGDPTKHGTMRLSEVLAALEAV